MPLPPGGGLSATLMRGGARKALFLLGRELPSRPAERDRLIARGGRHAEVLERGRAVRCSLDQQMCGDEAVLADGAELAFFPPVTGG